MRHLENPADIGDGLALGDQLLGGIELAVNLLRCRLGGFLGMCPAQSGRLRTLIHPGSVSGVHIKVQDNLRKDRISRPTRFSPNVSRKQALARRYTLTS